MCYDELTLQEFLENLDIDIVPMTRLSFKLVLFGGTQDKESIRDDD